MTVRASFAKLNTGADSNGNPVIIPDRVCRPGQVQWLMSLGAAKRGLDFAEAIVETVREPLVILNQNLQVIQANRTFYEAFQAVREETEGRLIYDLGNGQWNVPKLRELLENILPAHATFRDFEVTHEFEHVGRKVMLLNASEIFNPHARIRTILLAIEDVTDRKRAEDALTATNAKLQHFAYALTHDLQEPLRMVVNFKEPWSGSMRASWGGTPTNSSPTP